MTVADKHGHTEPALIALYLGRHSNIPECCINFYISKTHSQLIRLNRRRGLHDDPAVFYVMCTKCLRAYHKGKLRPNVLHDCEFDRKSWLCDYWIDGNWKAVEIYCAINELPDPISPDYTV
jgi:hypothetical protein